MSGELIDVKWADYYRRVSGRPPRPVLLDALEHLGSEVHTEPLTAVDLGSGDGTEFAYLLSQGWHVLAIDSEPAAFQYLREKIPPEAQVRLETQAAKFEAVELPSADLIYAGYSIPFCHPDHFDGLWGKITSNLRSGGRFAGQLYGVNDTWASTESMTFLTSEQVYELLEGFELEYFREEDEDGRSSTKPKHWRAFHIIARKR